MPDQRQNFIVTCHGWSASKWVAYALNRHPDIACGHSSAAILAEDPGLFDATGLKQHIPALRQGYLGRQGRPMAEVYAALAAQKPARYVGTVHTYRLRDLPRQAARFAPPPGSVRTLNLIRHPLDLVVSGYGQFQDLFQIDLKEFHWTLGKIVTEGLDIIEPLCERHGIAPGAYDTVCFFGACVVLGSLRLDLDAEAMIKADSDRPWGYQGIVRTEDVTAAPAAFADMLDRLIGRPGLATPDYLDAVFRQGRINVHNQSAARSTTQRWQNLQDWQRDGFRAFLTRFDLRPAYERFGYDFDFLGGKDG